MSHDRPTPVGGKLMTPRLRILLAVFLVGMALTVWRFVVGLGPSTGMNDGYPWGIWIAFDVVTGTALACGGYAVAFLVYIMNKGKYHPLVRPALLTSALGYSIAAVAIVIDVGRPWLIWRIPVQVGDWNLDSALLEVALCVMAYVAVLWIELSPAFFEKMEKAGKGGWVGFGRTMNRFMDKALLVLIALGMLLPTMHQSSLGSVIMLAGPRLHALWHTAWLPLLFLISCIAMGYAMVVMESTLSARAFGRKREDKMLRSLSGVIAFVLALFLLVRFADIMVAGKAGYLFASGLLSVLFWLEIILFAIPMLVLMTQRATTSAGCMFRQALFIAVGGALYRFNAYLVAYKPTENWGYFPSVPETLMTVGLVALEVLFFIWLIKYFPILSGTSVTADET